jgi:hypothetical protein
MKIEMDRLHIDKTIRYYNQTDSVLEPTEYERKRKTNEYMEKRLKKTIGVILLNTGEN